MKTLIISPAHTPTDVRVQLPDEVPDEMARVVSAILSTNHLVDEPVEYWVQQVNFGYYNVAEGKIGNYNRETQIIDIDLGRTADTVLYHAFIELDVRYYMVLTLLDVIAHEAIHAKNLAKHSAWDEAKDEEVARGEMEKLVEVSLNQFAIDADEQSVGWISEILYARIKERGLTHMMDYFHQDYVHQASDGAKSETWQAYLHYCQISNTTVDELLPLPIAVPMETPKPAERVVERPSVFNATVGQTKPVTAQATSTPAKPTELDEDDALLWEPPEDERETTVDWNTLLKPGNTTPPPVEPQADPAGVDHATVMEASEQPDMTDKQKLVHLFENVLYRIHEHIFAKCGWDGKGKLTNPGGVLEPVYVGDLDNIHMLAEYQYASPDGGPLRVQKGPIDYIKGHVSSQAGLPLYDLVFRVGNERVKRRIVPQNPNKGSNIARRAQEGNRITWVIDPDTGRFTYQAYNNYLNKKG